MQPIVAKYDADRWYSEVVTFVLFGTKVFFFYGDNELWKDGKHRSQCLTLITHQHPTKQEVRLCTTKYQLT